MPAAALLSSVVEFSLSLYAERLLFSNACFPSILHSRDQSREDFDTMPETRDRQLRALDSVLRSWNPPQDIIRAYDPMLLWDQTALDSSSVATPSDQLDHNNRMFTPFPTLRSRLYRQPSVDKPTVKRLLDVIDTVEKVFKEEVEKLQRTPSAKKAEREKKVRILMSMH